MVLVPDRELWRESNKYYTYKICAKEYSSKSDSVLVRDEELQRESPYCDNVPIECIGGKRRTTSMRRKSMCLLPINASWMRLEPFNWKLKSHANCRIDSRYARFVTCEFTDPEHGVEEQHAIQIPLYSTQEIYIPSDSQETSLQTCIQGFSVEVKIVEILMDLNWKWISENIWPLQKVRITCSSFTVRKVHLDSCSYVAKHEFSTHWKPLHFGLMYEIKWLLLTECYGANTACCECMGH